MGHSSHQINPTGPSSPVLAWPFPRTEAGCSRQPGTASAPTLASRVAGLPSVAPPPEVCLARTALGRRLQGASSSTPRTVGSCRGIQQVGGGQGQPGSHLRWGAGARARGACSHGPHGAHNWCHSSCGFEWAQLREAGSSGDGWELQFLHPGQGGSRSLRVENFFFTVWKRR